MYIFTIQIFLMKNSIYLILVFTTLLSLNAFSQDINKISSLAEKWELDSISLSQEVNFRLLPFKPVYVLLTNYTADVNKSPSSDNSDNDVKGSIPYNPVELVFQLSFKTKILRNIFGKKIGGDLWGAYTQSSHWQVYNNSLSRPFRETNYQPEAFILFKTPYKIGSIQGVFAGVGLNHQSNGRSDPLSRSWNRIIFQFGWQVQELQIVFNPWLRLPEDAADDDNPNIKDYMGRAELVLNYAIGKSEFELASRHSLRGGNRSHASARLDYSYRFYKNLKLHAQVFTGYGESLIDYNHNQTTIGVGLSLY